MEDIQSWWEVPSIAFFSSTFADALGLLDFEIEELEEALIIDSTEYEATILDHLMVRLLSGCLESKDVNLHNYDQYLKDYIVHQWQREGKKVDYSIGSSFKFLNLRCKVEILYSLCEYRLEVKDVADCVKNLDGDSLRVKPVGQDDTGAKYWYFYGTRLYKEAGDKSILQIKQQRENNMKQDRLQNRSGKTNSKIDLKADQFSIAESKKKSTITGKGEDHGYFPKVAWTIVCYGESDWLNLANKFSKSKSIKEKELYTSLNESLENIRRITVEKEKALRRRLIALLPKRVSLRIEGIKKQEKDATQVKEIEQKALAVEQEKQQLCLQRERQLQNIKRRGERASERIIAKEGSIVLRQRSKV